MSETVTSIRLTPAAAARVAKIAARQSAPAILRLSVEGGGCAGFSYKFGLATAPEADDLVTETDGVKLVIDPTSLDLLDGSEVDFSESLGGAAFQVRNPNAASGCGCGRSDEHTSELQSLMRISYAVFCLKNKKHTNHRK